MNAALRMKLCDINNTARHRHVVIVIVIVTVINTTRRRHIVTHATVAIGTHQVTRELIVVYQHGHRESTGTLSTLCYDDRAVCRCVARSIARFLCDS